MITKETLIELVKDSPVPAVAGLTLFGVSLNSWILILTAGWAVIRLASAAWDLYWKIKEKADARKREAAR